MRWFSRDIRPNLSKQKTAPLDGKNSKQQEKSQEKVKNVKKSL